MNWYIPEAPIDPPYENTDCSSLECESEKHWYHCPEDKKIWYSYPKKRGRNRCSECWMMRGFNRECICDLIAEKEGWYDQ